MNCHAIEAVLDLYVEGRLTPGRALTVSEHIKGCARCAPLAEDFRPKAAAVTAPAGLKERLKALSPDDLTRPRERNNGFFRRENLTVLAALIIVSVFLLLIHSAGTGIPSQRHLPVPAVLETPR